MLADTTDVMEHVRLDCDNDSAAYIIDADDPIPSEFCNPSSSSPTIAEHYRWRKRGHRNWAE
jgi:hypothetical protein